MNKIRSALKRMLFPNYRKVDPANNTILLPENVLNAILEHLSFKQQCQMRLVSVQFNRAMPLSSMCVENLSVPSQRGVILQLLLPKYGAKLGHLSSAIRFLQPGYEIRQKIKLVSVEFIAVYCPVLTILWIPKEYLMLEAIGLFPHLKVLALKGLKSGNSTTLSPSTIKTLENLEALRGLYMYLNEGRAIWTNARVPGLRRISVLNGGVLTNADSQNISSNLPCLNSIYCSGMTGDDFFSNLGQFTSPRSLALGRCNLKNLRKLPGNLTTLSLQYCSNACGPEVVSCLHNLIDFSYRAGPGSLSHIDVWFQHLASDAPVSRLVLEGSLSDSAVPLTSLILDRSYPIIELEVYLVELNMEISLSTDGMIQIIEKYPSLKKLHLGCQLAIDDVIFTPLLSLTQLRSLILCGTSCSTEGFLRFLANRKARIDSGISYEHLQLMCSGEPMLELHTRRTRECFAANAHVFTG